MRKVATVILAVGVLITVLTGCVFKSDQELIEDRIDNFLQAYNSGDLEGAIDCLDAKTRNTYKSAMNIGNELIGLTGFKVGLADLFGLSIGLMSQDEVLKLQNLEITITSETKATVTATLSYQDPSESYSQTVQIPMVKEDGDWFIRG